MYQKSAALEVLAKVSFLSEVDLIRGKMRAKINIWAGILEY